MFFAQVGRDVSHSPQPLKRKLYYHIHGRHFQKQAHFQPVKIPCLKGLVGFGVFFLRLPPLPKSKLSDKLFLLPTTVKTQEPRNNLGMETASSQAFVRVRGEKRFTGETNDVCLEKHRCKRTKAPEGRLQQMAPKQQQGSAQLMHSECHSQELSVFPAKATTIPTPLRSAATDAFKNTQLFY